MFKRLFSSILKPSEIYALRKEYANGDDAYLNYLLKTGFEKGDYFYIAA